MNNAVCAMGDPLFVARVHELDGELRDARCALRAEVERLIDELAPRIHEVARALPVLGPVGGLGVPLQKPCDTGLDSGELRKPANVIKELVE